MPCTNAASSLASQTAAWAIESGVPGVPAGVPRIIAVAGSGPSTGGRTTPGEIAFTRTPAGPNSAAHARVSVSSAPFVEL